ncbi:unnamed protein product [Effrenium voratum]|uniref:Pentatricopeptide repeat-containing protein, chloroplastic n=1 Tax=Effrenium voratum TaxID=2562239 RepID=A0AA36HQJ9_9DINO|nr:unnamed protein product [Effrenium voratum]
MLQLQLARLTECVLVQLDGRMRSLEQDLRKVSGQRLEADTSAALSSGSDEPGDGFNPPLSLVVSQSGNPSAVVTVEARARDKVQDVKTQAHQQLAIWTRFCNLELEEAQELPPLSACRLSKSEGDLLDDRKRLSQCRVSNGDELQLGPRSEASDARRGSRGREVPNVEEEDMPSTIIDVLVSHPRGEVNIEARSSEQVLALKRRALQQLEVWCRFSDACDGDHGAALPTLEEARLYAAGSGDGHVLPQPLEERRSLRACGLQVRDREDVWDRCCGFDAEMAASLSEDGRLRAGTQHLQSLGRGSRWRGAVNCLEQLTQELQADVVVISAALTACAPGAAWVHALRLLRTAVDAALRADVVAYGAEIAACEKASQWRFVQSLLTARIANDPSVMRNSVMRNAAISATGAKGAWQQARQLLKSDSADIVTYNALISADISWQLASAWLHLAQAKGLEADAITYNATISSLGNSWRRACEFLRELGIGRLTADVVTYNATLAAGAEAAWQQASALLADLTARGLRADAYSFSAAMTASDKSGQWQHAERLLVRRPRLGRNAVLANGCLSAQEKGSQWRRVQLMLGELKGDGCRLELLGLNAGISACQKCSKWQRGQALLTDLEAGTRFERCRE